MSEQIPEEQLPEEIEVEYTSRLDYINAGVMSLGAVGELDPMIMSKIDEQRIKRIRRKALRIIDECLSEMYDELFDDDE